MTYTIPIKQKSFVLAAFITLILIVLAIAIRHGTIFMIAGFFIIIIVFAVMIFGGFAKFKGKN